MKKLFAQIMKFGIVGVICFLIDYVITLGVSWALRLGGMGVKNAALIGAIFGFTISVVINYILSMKYVFTRKEDMDRKREFVIFVILSLIGLGLNELIIAFSIDVVYVHISALAGILSPGMATAFAKIVATGVVMVYNFITRKMFLEQKEEKTEDAEKEEG